MLIFNKRLVFLHLKIAFLKYTTINSSRCVYVYAFTMHFIPLKFTNIPITVCKGVFSFPYFFAIDEIPYVSVTVCKAIGAMTSSFPKVPSWTQT